MTDPSAAILALSVLGAGIILALVASLWLRRRRAAPTHVGQGAERLAELLLMEIKLYNADELDVARREKRILATFEKEIARARSLFEERFPRGTPGWPAFDLEIVKSLAEGDGEALGPRPPGSF